MLNRSALIVRPAEPYLKWARSLDASGIEPDPQDEQTVYLIPPVELPEDEQAVLKAVFKEVFARELFAWHTDEAQWPKRRTYKMFCEWFKIEIHTIVEDLCSVAIYDDEFDEHQ